MEPGRRAIENKNRFIRDAAFGDGGGRMRTGHGPTSSVLRATVADAKRRCSLNRPEILEDLFSNA